MKINVANVLFRQLNVTASAGGDINDVGDIKRKPDYKGTDCFILFGEKGNEDQYILNVQLLDVLYVHRRYKKTCNELVRQIRF
jgi:hypothetical protein